MAAKRPILPAHDEVNPAVKNYRRKRKHRQFLTEKQGSDHFRSQVTTMMTVLRIFGNKDEFKKHFKRFYGDQLEFGF